MSVPDPSDAAAPPRRSAALVFIFVTVALDMIALGIIVPVLPKLVVDFLHGDMAKAAKVFGVFGTVWALMQFVFAPVLGAVSDRFGRRPVILLSNFGSGLDYILMALSPGIGWLFVGRLFSGITTASIPTATAYVADVTPPEKRAAGFGLLGAAFGLGFVLGPALGGILGETDPRLPFWVAAGLSLANACYGMFVLPESLGHDRRAAFTWRRANPVASLGLLGSHPELLGLTAVIFLFYLAHEVYPSVYVLYVKYRFDLDARTVGLMFALVGVGSAVVQTVLTRPAVARMGERGTLIAGTCFGMLSFAVYGLAWTPWQFWLAIPLGSLWGLAGPATQAIMSRRVDATEQGRLQGAMGSLRGITGMMGPGLFTLTFAAFIHGGGMAARGWHLPGAPFLVSALLLFAALWVGLRVSRGGPAVTPAALEAVPPSTFTSDVS